MTDWLRWLPLAHLVLCAVILVWDVVLAGRIARLSAASHPFAAITGLCGLLVLPAAMLFVATATVITDRAVALVDWIWPAVLVLFAIQAAYATARGLVNAAWGLPIAVYDIVIALAAIARFLVSHGISPLTPGAALLAAQSTTMAVATSSLTATTPLYFNVPMIAPAFPALRRVTASFRALMAMVATAWVVAIFTIGVDGAVRATASYRRHEADKLHERPLGDFAVGLKILPDVAGNPSPRAARGDIALADSLQVGAIAVVVTPGATAAQLDSASRVIDQTRGDSTVLIVAIGYHEGLLPSFSRTALDESARMITVERVMRHLHPDILLPAEDPYGRGARVFGVLPVARWQDYLSHAARTAKAIDPHVKVGVSIARYGNADSVLFAWAAAAHSPMDVVGFTLYPQRQGLDDLDKTFEPAASRWMQATPPAKPVWVFGAGGFPLNFGVESQQQAIMQVLSWATGIPAIKGMIVYEGSDYGAARGLRAANGSLRPSAGALMKSIEALKASIGGQ